MDEPTLGTGKPGIRPQSAELYKALAFTRRTLRECPNLEAKDLRDLCERLCEGAELLLRSVDNLATILEDLVERHTPRSPRDD